MAYSRKLQLRHHNKAKQNHSFFHPTTTMDLLLRSTTLEESNPIPLPAELEREIFRLAAKICPQTAPTLLRVARRVLVWVEPLLYETLILDCSVDDSLHPSLRLILKTKPPDFFRQHVRNLFLGGVFGELDIVRSLCSVLNNVVNLALVGDSSLLPLFKSVKLEHLGVYTYPPLDFTLPVLSTITHLDTFGGDIPITTLASLSTLTHLRVFLRRNSFMQEILSHCKNLHVVVNAFTDEMKFAEQCRDLSVDDSRLVMLHINGETRFVTPWKDGVQGGLGIWGEAELFIAKKRRGEIKPASRCWIEPSDLIS
ncbi:hypothetical protein C8R43DRAFT_1229140 [Mycena crocata]|nr:hypothetical protein C8R43DRAFT_1229140 [Mycena crocata]